MYVKKTRKFLSSCEGISIDLGGACVLRGPLDEIDAPCMLDIGEEKKRQFAFLTVGLRVASM